MTDLKPGRELDLLVAESAEDQTPPAYAYTTPDGVLEGARAYAAREDLPKFLYCPCCHKFSLERDEFDRHVESHGPSLTESSSQVEG